MIRAGRELHRAAGIHRRTATIGVLKTCSMAGWPGPIRSTWAWRWTQRRGWRGLQRAWALGPLTKGAFWEIIAVPDIRGQVAAVADDIAEELKRDHLP